MLVNLTKWTFKSDDMSKRKEKKSALQEMRFAYLLPVSAAVPQSQWGRRVPLAGGEPTPLGPGWPVCAGPPGLRWSAAASGN